VSAAPAAAVPTAQAENIDALVQAIRLTAKAGGWEATVRLRPEHLGEVNIALRVEGNSVSAVVQAESSGVRQWLSAQEEAVRSGLAEQGLQLDKYVVDRDGQQSAHDQQDEEEQRQRSRRGQLRRSTNESTERFEIVV
jgi:flagellar hook-length control protein FliK